MARYIESESAGKGLKLQYHEDRHFERLHQQ